MKYLITQQYPNLVGNHAGFPHICKLLQRKYPQRYVVIECKPVSDVSLSNNRFVNYIYSYLDRLTHRSFFKKYLFKRCEGMFRQLKDNDEVFLLEYNIKSIHQYELACYIRKHFPNVKIYAMGHLSPSKMKKMVNNKTLIKWNQPIDMNLTLGSSLSEYLESEGIHKDKISTGFHAVDSEYYNNFSDIIMKDKITIITIGALQRDYKMLGEIVRNCNNVNWIICKGNKNLGHIFDGLSNVRVVGFIPEDELRAYMREADVSLNVLEDTVGSNVITTSMAMGLGIIVSDVGSIRDYCSDENAIFCDNSVESFVNAINRIKETPSILFDMKSASLEMSKKFSIQNTNTWFSSLFVQEC